MTLEIAPLNEGPSLVISALILPRLTLYDGGARADHRDWPHLQGLDLADSDYLAADLVDLLLGADVHGTILQPGLRKGLSHEPVTQQTVLGWIVSGTTGRDTPPRGASITYAVWTRSCPPLCEASGSRRSCQLAPQRSPWKTRRANTFLLGRTPEARTAGTWCGCQWWTRCLTS